MTTGQAPPDASVPSRDGSARNVAAVASFVLALVRTAAEAINFLAESVLQNLLEEILQHLPDHSVAAVEHLVTAGQIATLFLVFVLAWLGIRRSRFAGAPHRGLAIAAVWITILPALASRFFFSVL